MTSYLLKTSLGSVLRSLPVSVFRHVPIRMAGHAKWQNIRSTKTSKDMERSQKFAAICYKIRRAVSAGGQDPKLNTELRNIIEEARKINMPSATIDRSINMMANMKKYSVILEVQGPGGCFILVDCDTESASKMRYNLVGAMRKFKGLGVGILKEGQAMHAFAEKGFILISKQDNDDKPISFERVEEIAIEAGAEEVVTDDSSDSEMWQLITDKLDIYTVKKFMEVNHPEVNIVDAELRFTPMRLVELNDTEMENASALCDALQEVEQVVKIYDNIA